MPAPPPPPPPPPGPPPPPPPSASLPQSPSEPPQLQPGRGGGRSALLADIQKGAKLRKVTQVNDRSAPAVDQPKPNNGDAAATHSSSAGMAPTGPCLGGLFSGGFPTLRPIGHRDLAGKTPVSRSSSAASLRPQWNPPTPTDSSSLPESHKAAEIYTSSQRLLTPSSAPPSPSHSSKHSPPFLASVPPTPPPAPPSIPPPPPLPQALQERPASKPPSLPSCPPPPPPPSQITRPTWLPVQHSHHSYVAHPSAPPPPPPSSIPGDRSSGCFFYSPPPVAACSEPSRFPILRDSPLGPPPPPPPPPPLPTSLTPSCPTNLPPPPPKLAPVPSLAMRSLLPSFPCNVPTRRPPSVPRSLGVDRLLAPPPPPPARSPTTELSTRILPPPPPPPPPPFILRNGHLHSMVEEFESKFQFHPIEDLPPPEEFKPFPRIYPSKEHRVNPKPPGIRTHLR